MDKAKVVLLLRQGIGQHSLGFIIIIHTVKES